MVTINWCRGQSKGIKLIKSKENLINGYLKMAKDSIGTMNRERDKNIIFSISAGYYSIYYSLYSILQKIGIKCEIHSCSIEIMKKLLSDFYSTKDTKLIETAFLLRNNLQYYVDKNVNKKDMKLVWEGSYDFFVKSREILNKLDSINIKKIRDRLK